MVIYGLGIVGGWMLRDWQRDREELREAEEDIDRAVREVGDA
jgi:hypothetical protein